MTTRLTLAVAALLAASLAACGGGGRGGALPAQTPAATASHQKAAASATIVIPAPGRAGATSARRVSWISPSTMSIYVQAQRSDGFTDAETVALTPTSSNCTALAGGARSCTVPFSAPVTSGSLTDEIVLQLFDNIDPFFSQVLASADVVKQTVTGSATNTFAFVLGGTVGRPIASPVPSPATVTHGTPSTVTIPIAVTDYRTNPISGLLDSPLKVTLSNATSFSFATPAAQPDGSVSIADTSQTPSITLNYNGGTTATTLTIATTSFDSANIAGSSSGFSTGLTITPK